MALSLIDQHVVRSKLERVRYQMHELEIEHGEIQDEGDNFWYWFRNTDHARLYQSLCDEARELASKLRSK